jgi:CspA family cold shock protein
MAFRCRNETVANRRSVTVFPKKIAVREDLPDSVSGGRNVSIGKSMAQGTVKWFNSTKGFGFIAPDDGSKDAFVHISAVERAGIANLAEGQRVQYELQPGRDGKSSAENLSIIS